MLPRGFQSAAQREHLPRKACAQAIACAQHVGKLVIADQTRHGVGDWIEQLVAESTGKLGKGVLPVVVPHENAVNFNPSSADSILVTVGGDDPAEAQSGFAVAISGELGAQMLLWEVAVAVAGRLIGIDPFDQPDVESAKKAARELLDGGGGVPTPDFTDRGIDVYGSGSSLDDALGDLLNHVDLAHGYLAVQVYLDRIAYADFADIREVIETHDVS